MSRVSLVSTNIPQEEGITIVCNAYEVSHEHNAPIATAVLKEMLGSYLKKIPSNLMVETLQTHGTAMGTKTGRCAMAQVDHLH